MTHKRFYTLNGILNKLSVYKTRVSGNITNYDKLINDFISKWEPSTRNMKANSHE